MIENTIKKKYNTHTHIHMHTLLWYWKFSGNWQSSLLFHHKNWFRLAKEKPFYKMVNVNENVTFFFYFINSKTFISITISIFNLIFFFTTVSFIIFSAGNSILIMCVCVFFSLEPIRKHIFFCWLRISLNHFQFECFRILLWK